ncbi:MAG: hypothetical protein DRI94_13465 [Bacteroidetes bacterium]|nr:MAG: hypothetical protein DRI94_13465 [Bacteroidota bacterium]
MRILTFLNIAFIGLLLTNCTSNTDVTQEEWTEVKKDTTEIQNKNKVNTENNILLCNIVYFTLNDGSTTNNTDFIYGERFQINFDNMSGFNRINGEIYPAMAIFVLNENNDTIFKTDNLYKDSYKTVNVSLNAYLKCADPMHSNSTYHAFINIWDRKGKGTLVSDFNFTIKPNDKISVKTNNLSYNEIYLKSKDSKEVIIDNNVNLYERVYIVFEGLKGFKVIDSLANMGMNIVVTDINGDTTYYNPDFFPEPVNAYALYQMSYIKLFFKDKNVKSPLQCKVLIWDKKSDADLTADFKLNLIQ